MVNSLVVQDMQAKPVSRGCLPSKIRSDQDSRAPHVPQLLQPGHPAMLAALLNDCPMQEFNRPGRA